MRDGLAEQVVGALAQAGFCDRQGQPAAGRMNKDVLRSLHGPARAEQQAATRDFLIRALPRVRACLPGRGAIDPAAIRLTLRAVTPGSEMETLFRFWNLVWWSLPYQRAYGRQLRFVLWDEAHDSPFGLVGLQSPILNLGPVNDYLNLSRVSRDEVVNRSLTAQRLGALPPYNNLLGGKMVALTLLSDELRAAYRDKYRGVKTLMAGRTLSAELLYLTTTSAYGRSSIYNRLTYQGQKAAIGLGYTSGYGSFHIPESLYLALKDYLSGQGIDTAMGYGHGPSQKMRLIKRAMRLLGLPNLTHHRVAREIFLFPLAENLPDVIDSGAKPVYPQRPLDALCAWWAERWALGRATRRPDWAGAPAQVRLEGLLAEAGLTADKGTGAMRAS